MWLTILAIYFGIGLLYGGATCMKFWTEWSNAPEINKIYAKINKGIYGDHWLTYVVVLVTRLIAWPIYLVSKFVA